MRVLFFTSSDIWSYALPIGFKKTRHEVKISGPLTEYGTIKMINDFYPHLVISIGWGDEQIEGKPYWIQKY